jgi:hypothetical protein
MIALCRELKTGRLQFRRLQLRNYATWTPTPGWVVLTWRRRPLIGGPGATVARNLRAQIADAGARIAAESGEIVVTT